MDPVLQAKRDELLARWQEINDLTGITALLGGDKSTYMLAARGAVRGRQIAFV